MSHLLYSNCFCGSGKKTKFCCADLAPDLEKIQRLCEGEQYAAALEHVNRLIERRAAQGKPHHAGLWAERLWLMLNLRDEQWRDEAFRFAAEFSNNTRALSLRGIARLEEIASRAELTAERIDELRRAALDDWLTCRELVADNPLPTEWVMLTGAMVQTLLDSQWYRAAYYTLRWLISIAKWARSVFSDLMSDTTIPLVLRHGEDFGQWPEVSQSPELSQAWNHICKFLWRQAERDLERIISQTDCPVVAWRLLAEAKMLLGRFDDAKAALRKYIEHWPSSLDVYEAELLLSALGGSDESDRVRQTMIRWTITDPERFNETLFSDSRFELDNQPLPPNLESEVPLKTFRMFDDREPPSDAEPDHWEKLPRLVGLMVVTPKQTDAPAKLAFFPCPAVADRAIELLTAAVGSWLTDRKESFTFTLDTLGELLRRSIRMPRSLKPEARERLFQQFLRDQILREWPSQTAPSLNGRTFFEAAADPSLRMRVLALIDSAEDQQQGIVFRKWFAELRSELGVLTPLEDGRGSPTRFRALLFRYLDPKTLSDDELHELTVSAIQYNHLLGIVRLGEELLSRDSLRECPDWPDVFLTVVEAMPSNEALPQWLETARKLGDTKIPRRLLRLIEARWHMHRGNRSRYVEILRGELNLCRTQEEMAVFTQMIVELGLAPPGFFSSTLQKQATDAVPMTEPSLWTPDSAAPAAGGGSGGGKLWVPD